MKKKPTKKLWAWVTIMITQLDFAYLKENQRLMATDLTKQTKLKDSQQINFIGKLENQDHEVTMFFIIEKLEETTFNFSQNSVNIL